MTGAELHARLAAIFPRDALAAAEALGVHPATLRRYKRRAAVPRTVELALAAIEVGIVAHHGDRLGLATTAGASLIDHAMPIEEVSRRIAGPTPRD